MHRTKVRVVEDALDANNTIARANRDDFDRHDVTVLNLMSAPGAGKTTLLERALGEPLAGIRVGVLEGDVQGSIDADRLASLHVPVTQLNTDNGFGGECHLDANMVRSALGELPLHEIDLLVIENVGNLVCPAEFRVGEDARAMVCSITEGEDKPLKYPLMFRSCELVVINKLDLLPHLEVDLDKLLYNIDVGQPRRRDDAGQRPHRRGGRRAARQWLAELAHRRVTATAGMSSVRSAVAGARAARAPAGAAPGAPARRFFAAEADRIARLCHRDGRALRPRRTADRGRTLPGRALGRAPCRGRVRPSGDRRQARAARARADRRVGRVTRELALVAEPDDIVIAFGEPADGPELAAAARRRARAAARSTIAFAALGAEWTFEPPSDDPFVRQELVETAVPRPVGARARVLRAPRPAGGPNRAPLARRRRLELPVSVPGRARARPRRRPRRRPRLGADEGRGGPRAARGDAARARRRAGGGGGRARARLRRRRPAAGAGNGGSATDAMDVVADFVSPPAAFGWPRRPALDLCADTAIITAIANDIGTEAIFARQIIAYGRAGRRAAGSVDQRQLAERARRAGARPAAAS